MNYKFRPVIVLLVLSVKNTLYSCPWKFLHATRTEKFTTLPEKKITFFTLLGNCFIIFFFSSLNPVTVEEQSDKTQEETLVESTEENKEASIPEAPEDILVDSAETSQAEIQEPPEKIPVESAEENKEASIQKPPEDILVDSAVTSQAEIQEPPEKIPIESAEENKEASIPEAPEDILVDSAETSQADLQEPPEKILVESAEENKEASIQKPPEDILVDSAVTRETEIQDAPEKTLVERAERRDVRIQYSSEDTFIKSAAPWEAELPVVILMDTIETKDAGIQKLLANILVDSHPVTVEEESDKVQVETPLDTHTGNGHSKSFQCSKISLSTYNF